MEDILDLGDEETVVERPLPSFQNLLQSRRFIVWSIIGFLQAVGLISGILILVYGSYDIRVKFQLWRICFLITCLPFTWLLANLLVHIIIKIVEKLMMTVLNALYFAYAVRVS